MRHSADAIILILLGVMSATQIHNKADESSLSPVFVGSTPRAAFALIFLGTIYINTI